jgi:hypothetical protein
MRKLGVLMAGGIALAVAGGVVLAERKRSLAATDSRDGGLGPIEITPDGGLGPIEIMPADLRVLEAAGTRDFKNKYSSTVMVTTKDPLEAAECSGVIIGPRLVLTAGHCVCKPDTADASTAARVRRMDAAACAGEAKAIVLLYGKVSSAYVADLQARVYFGVIRPHPELQLVLDDSGAIVSAQANLALLVLDEPVEGGIPSVVLADTEITPGESLVMAGYGYDKQRGGMYGARYYRKNKTVTSQASSGGRFVYEQQGAYLYNGFDGGPCFREHGTNRWLVGISGAGTEEELSLTSTVFFGAWLKSELARAPR